MKKNPEPKNKPGNATPARRMSTKVDAPDKPNLTHFLKEVEYRLDFSPSGDETGRWLSKEKGAGLDFEELVSFLACPQSQQIDLLATMRTLSPIPLVRIYRETGRINVIMLADMSRSMSFGSQEPKTWLMAKLTTMLGYTAYRFGDKFGFYGCDEDVIEELVFAPQRSKTYGLEIGEKLLEFQPSKDSLGGLISAMALLPAKKSLVVVASDFYCPQETTEKLVAELTLRHQVICFVLRDEKENVWPDKFLGFVNLKEMESADKKTVLFSRKNAQRLKERSETERRALENIFKKYDIAPIFLESADAEKISKELEGGRR